MPTAVGARGSPAGSPPIVMEIAGIATRRGGVAERAAALLERLHRLVPYDASFVALVQPDRREHLYLVRNGYDERTCAYLDGTDFMADLELIGLPRTRHAIRVCDFPLPPDQVRSWADYLAPAGFREGIGVGLFTPEGRYLGVVVLHTEDAEPSTDAVRDLFGALAPLIAHAVDPMRTVSAVARAITDAVAGAVVTRTGHPVPLPGRPAHPLLSTGSGLLPVAIDRLAGGGVHARFLCPAAGPQEYLGVTAVSAPPDPPCHFAAIVTLSPPGHLYGLTCRELEALGLVVEGWPNHAIALELGITERTVAAHVEHILAKLGVTSRTVAAVSALRLGLFVPRLLHGAGLPGD
ncbi:MAG: helix-turn-helix transcriptional regulator [Mycobacterium sp.]|nr:helix-turn-helix transcriptional regulator [Mycobacterium sp.]